MNTIVSAKPKPKAIPANAAANNKNTAPPVAINAQKTTEKPKVNTKKIIDSSVSSIGDSPVSKGLPDSFFHKRYVSRKQQRKNSRRSQGKKEIAGKLAFPAAALLLVALPVGSGTAIAFHKNKKKAAKNNAAEQKAEPAKQEDPNKVAAGEAVQPQAANTKGDENEVLQSLVAQISDIKSSGDNTADDKGAVVSDKAIQSKV